jgi:hypothetical protein
MNFCSFNADNAWEVASVILVRKATIKKVKTHNSIVKSNI